MAGEDNPKEESSPGVGDVKTSLGVEHAITRMQNLAMDLKGEGVLHMYKSLKTGHWNC